MQKTVLINGYFLCRPQTGIERYASEITECLDNLCKKDEIAIIIPGNSKNIPSYKNIKIILYKKKIQHIAWQMFVLQFFLLRHKQYTILEFGNTALPFAPGIVFLHDIYCEFFKEDFTSFRDKLVRLYNKWQYRLIAKKAKQICTVSNYSKNQIAETYHVSPAKIKVIYPSCDHFNIVVSDNSIFEDYPTLLKKPFYFSLGSLSKRKNLKWIIEYASKNKDSLFAITGSELPVVKIKELNVLPKNVILLGYLDDAKVKALMQACRAFILPSYYEGFGLTPLEALSCGTEIIISNAASLPEIYGGAAHYINPFDTNINLDDLLKEPVENSSDVLKKYSYNDSALQLYNIVKEQLKS